MDLNMCLKELRKIKSSAFATVDEKGLPQIRMIDVMLVEDGNVYICTARGKGFYSQLMSNGNVAVTAMNPGYQMVRVSGRAEKLSEQKVWIDRIFEENPVMNGVYPGDSRYVLEPFCISVSEWEFFDLGKSPIERAGGVVAENNDTSELKTESEKMASAGAVKKDAADSQIKSPESQIRKGFCITDECIGCGKCKTVCPQQCISEGSPYKIAQEHCLHCGLCFEKCPVQAIAKMGA